MAISTGKMNPCDGSLEPSHREMGGSKIPEVEPDLDLHGDIAMRRGGVVALFSDRQIGILGSEDGSLLLMERF